MKQQHTPGPWQMGEYCETTGSISVFHNGPIVYVKDNGDGVDNQLANARLIASAPELLEALEAVDKAMANDPRWKVSTLRLDVVRTAIAKAKGETL